MFCKKCGKEILDEAVICPNCGCATGNTVQNNIVTEPDAWDKGMEWLGFFIPIVGVILYFVWKDKTPLKAKSAGRGALAGIGFVICVSIFCGIIFGAAFL